MMSFRPAGVRNKGPEWVWGNIPVPFSILYEIIFALFFVLFTICRDWVLHPYSVVLCFVIYFIFILGLYLVQILSCVIFSFVLMKNRSSRNLDFIFFIVSMVILVCNAIGCNFTYQIQGHYLIIWLHFEPLE